MLAWCGLWLAWCCLLDVACFSLCMIAGLLVTYYEAVRNSVTSKTEDCYLSAGDRFDRWIHSLPESVFVLKDGSRMYPYSIQVVIAYLVLLYKKKKSTSEALHMMGYVNMMRIGAGYSRLASLDSYAIVKQLMRAVKGRSKRSVMVLPDMARLLELLQKGGNSVVCITLFMYLLGCLCALRTQEIWNLSAEYIYKDKTTGVYEIHWPKGTVKAGLRRVLPSYCIPMINIFCAWFP